MLAIRADFSVLHRLKSAVRPQLLFIDEHAALAQQISPIPSVLRVEQKQEAKLIGASGQG